MTATAEAISVVNYIHTLRLARERHFARRYLQYLRDGLPIGWLAAAREHIGGRRANQIMTAIDALLRSPEDRAQEAEAHRTRGSLTWD